MKKSISLFIIIFITIFTFAFEFEAGITQGIFPYGCFTVNLPFGLYIGTSYSHILLPNNPDNSSLLFKSNFFNDIEKFTLIMPAEINVGISAELIKLFGFSLNIKTGGKAMYSLNNNTLYYGAELKSIFLKDFSSGKLGITAGISGFMYEAVNFENTKKAVQYMIIPEFGITIRF